MYYLPHRRAEKDMLILAVTIAAAMLGLLLPMAIGCGEVVCQDILNPVCGKDGKG